MTPATRLRLVAAAFMLPAVVTLILVLLQPHEWRSVLHVSTFVGPALAIDLLRRSPRVLFYAKGFLLLGLYILSFGFLLTLASPETPLRFGNSFDQAITLTRAQGAIFLVVVAVVMVWQYLALTRSDTAALFEPRARR